MKMDFEKITFKGEEAGQGKTLFAQIQDDINSTFEKAYDKVYQHVFQEIKTNADGTLSDEEIRDFIENNINFELEVKFPPQETPMFVITPVLKNRELQNL